MRKKKKIVNYLGTSKKEIRNKIIVNCITLIRSLGTIIIIPIFFLCNYFVTAISVLCFFATDFIDGFLARKLHVQSFFGSLLDAVSDKAFGVVCLILLSTLNPIFFVIACVELGIVGINYSSIQRGNNVKSSIIGKIKTVCLTLCIIGGLGSYAIPDIIEIFKIKGLDFLLAQNANLISTVFAFPVLILNVYVFIDYLRKAHKQDKITDDSLSKTVQIEFGEAVSLEDLKEKKKKYIKKVKEELVLKSKEEIKRDLFNTEFYLKNCGGGIKRLLYKDKGSE